jgi:cytochrome oxidase Cu insertion factor (SCO1/SenC/PrrC family)
VSGPVETEGEVPVAPGEHGPDANGASAPPTVDRAAALAEGAPGVPMRFIWWLLGAVLLLSLGGLIAEHVVSAVGLNPSSVTTTTAPNPVRTSPGDTPAPPTPDQTLGAPLASFMGLSAPSPRPATPFTLTDEQGQPVSVPAQPPRVVVLTFFDATCNDICPVLASEIEQADSDLGAHAADVEFVTVNTDPSALAPGAVTAGIGATGLDALPNWVMVTGPLTSINPIWKAYGVSISVNPKSGLEVHSDVMDFLDAQGVLRYKATPFANESSAGTFTLTGSSEARWAQGIATYAGGLVGQ